ncbi:hypothetical protein [Xanthomonas phage vB_XooS_NR08]|nr:hypothetical protein [Xanthomonas phage vB_XooS_NR08]
MGPFYRQLQCTWMDMAVKSVCTKSWVRKGAQRRKIS